jgi:hypothetical protein
MLCPHFACRLLSFYWLCIVLVIICVVFVACVRDPAVSIYVSAWKSLLNGRILKLQLVSSQLRCHNATRFRTTDPQGRLGSSTISDPLRAIQRNCFIDLVRISGFE